MLKDELYDSLEKIYSTVKALSVFNQQSILSTWKSSSLE